jgi:hypothetical protein
MVVFITPSFPVLMTHQDWVFLVVKGDSTPRVSTGVDLVALDGRGAINGKHGEVWGLVLEGASQCPTDT